jgi:uncharacterized membrane protein
MGEKPKLNILTILVRVIVFIIGFIIITLIFAMSKMIIPVSGIGGMIRGGISIFLLYALWKGIKKINIST